MSQVDTPDRVPIAPLRGDANAPASGAEEWLAILLRIAGGVMLLAFGAVFMPTEWMAASHRWLGLGEFPASPLVNYLTRSASVLYGIHGGLYVVVAQDVRRYAGVLRYLALTAVLFGALILGIDLHAGMPWYWTFSEGPSVLAFGVLLLALQRSVPRT